MKLRTIEEQINVIARLDNILHVFAFLFTSIIMVVLLAVGFITLDVNWFGFRAFLFMAVLNLSTWIDFGKDD